MAEQRMPLRDGRFKDIAGQRFGLLTAIEPVEYRNLQWYWRCQCDCGGTKVASGIQLRKGLTRSCGCLIAARAAANTRHGHSSGGASTPEYRTWVSMRSRCRNPNTTHFSFYGGRGIRVCPEWDASFEAFLRDVGPRPSDDHSLDRIDNDRGYEPGNVRWAPSAIQNRNKRSFNFYEYEGDMLTMPQIADRTGIPLDRLRYRIAQGWSLQEAIELPALRIQPDKAK